MPEAWRAARPRVHSIAVELTGFCNQRCDYCYNAFREDGGAEVGTPALATLLARLDRILDAADVEHVTLTGGEPLASHDLFAVLDHLRSRHVRAQMISNGGLVTEAVAARLARYRLLGVLITLNGPDAVLHDPLVIGASPGEASRTKSPFELTLGGIRRLRAARVPVEGSVVLTRKNAHRTGETIRLFLSLGVRKIALSRFSPAGYSTPRAAELLPSRADVTLAFEQAAAIRREIGDRLTLFSTMPIPPCAVEVSRFPEIELHHCPIGTAQQEFALGPRGDLRHCALHRDPIGGAADVLDPGLDVGRLFASGDPHRYRAALPSYCRGCEHASTCGGGCGAAALWAGDRGGPDPFVTSNGKRSLPVVG